MNDTHPLDVAAVAADDALVERLRRGEHPHPHAHPLASHLAAWRAETRGDLITMPNLKTTAQQVAEGAARRDDRDGPQTEYKIKVRARVPLADAGKSATVKVTGKGTKREIVRQLEQEGYSVERIERKTGWGFYW